jgi:16S rRNA (cytosine967-C5)-methyltransferase
VVEVAARGRRLEAAVAAQAPEGASRPAIQALAFGTIRWFTELEAILGLLLDRPDAPLPREVRALALVGLYQLAHGATPPHAAVSETVEAAPALGHPRAKGLVNALLRRFQRERDAVVAAAHADRAARLAHPPWLLAAFERDWPAQWEQIAAAGNAEPPMWLRVNARRTTRDEYRARLAAAGMESEPCGFAPQALRLAEPVDVARLPGFAGGDVSVQDAAAQLAAFFLAPAGGMRVLDACAAPGGKTGHVLELADATLTALDSDEGRLARVRANLGRLGFAARVVCGDAREPASWWDGAPFERILADVPCSASGVARRHPDIKWLRRETDIAQFAHLQASMLEALWQTLASGGKLLYATCSVFREENSDQVARFLEHHQDATRIILPAVDNDIQLPAGQLLPDERHDGFFYALLQKA